MSERPIYLDYAATTPVDPRVMDMMLGYLGPGGEFGNPGSITHVYGARAAAAVEEARAQVAALLDAEPREIVFTSGATESINLALQGAARANARRGRHIVTCKSEHKAVLDTCHHLERQGFAVTYLDPSPDGRLEPEAVAAALRPDTVLVSLMHVNNETGVVQDLAALAALTRAHGVLLHVDAAQSAGKLPLDVQAVPGIDLLSLSGHKLYAPKGVGALYVRRFPKVRLEPLLYGGGQERGLRSGTLAVHQIVALGAACRIAREEMASEQARIAALRQRLWQGLSALPGVRLNGHPERRVAGILSVAFPGLDGEALLADLPGLALSAGSACTSASNEPSHVLKALGLPDHLARASLRFSLGRWTTAAEVDIALTQVTAAVRRLRALSPLWPDAA
ncbi:MAG TPA: aminotransferase class V-fold PLP-dependent enzyme [Candidatus Competibacteraceae bacterium]|nr:aminotransferase class V-fold PLP-dependent enzyme [Candidatus Competibacteraceae bacterium]